jgi:Mg/Co/Ni transporter MgtE
MRALGLRRIPVVDATGGLAGVLAFDDLIEILAEEMGDLVTLISRERRREEARVP